MAKRKPLHELPKAKGRPRGKPCIVCTERKPYDCFRPQRRICIDCEKIDAHQETFIHQCRHCGSRFEAPSRNATLCSDACWRFIRALQASRRRKSKTRVNKRR